MPNDLWNQLATSAKRPLSDGQLKQLDRYLDLLLDANTRMNLTRIVDREQAAIGHVGDALTLLPFLPTHSFTLADIGSGGGVPGIPLAIACPECTIILIESTNKKAVFLRSCADQIGLSNVRVLPVRAEEAGRGPLRETLDFVTARGVGELVFLIEWGIPILRKGGKLLAMKGAKAADEIADSQRVLRALNASDAITHPVKLPGAEHHVIVEIKKLGGTDPRYPRDATSAKGRAIK